MPDADLIAQAAIVTRLSRLVDRAYERLARKGDAVMAAAGPKPTGPAAQSGVCLLDEHAVDPASDVERRFTMTLKTPPADHQKAKRRHAEALKAWEAERDRLARDAGEADAEGLCDALSNRLAEAIDGLAAMRAASPAGMVAKGSAFLAVMEKLQGAEEYEVELARSLARRGAARRTGCMSALPSSRRRRRPVPIKLAPDLRARVEAAIEHLILLLDALDPDPDCEPTFGYLPEGASSDDCEPDVDGEPCLGSPEHHYDQRRWGQGRDSRELNHDEHFLAAFGWEEIAKRKVARREAEAMVRRAQRRFGSQAR